MRSLTARLLLAVSLLLLVFFGATVYVLDLSFRSAAEEAVRDRLDVHTIALLSAAEPMADGRLNFPDPIPESHFENPGSGLYGSIFGRDGRLIWRSPSLVGTEIDFPASVARGARSFQRLQASDGTRVFALSTGIDWELNGNGNLGLVVNVAESQSAFAAQVRRFRRQLLGWFGGLMALMLAAQALLLGWVLSPLRRAESEVRAIEHGERSALGEDYPRELAGLTRHTNILLDTERARVTRYRDTLGNLAHSVKTPLAVIRNAAEGLREQQDKGQLIDEQVTRIQKILDYQLKRAAASGGSLSIRAVNVADTVNDIIETLQKVHHKPSLKVERQVDAGLNFLGDRGDLLEILGNLLDNAYKWAHSTIRVSAHASNEKIGHGDAMTLTIEDDGPGIPDAQRDFVLGRGSRGDEQTEGHGIGLAVVRETVALQGGSVSIGRSELGGARIGLALPAR